MAIIVSNPYNFNINNNTRFDATINAALPDEETILYKTDSSYVKQFINLTIPSGVNVVKAYCYAEIVDSDYDAVSYAIIASYINDNKYNKTWATADVDRDGTQYITQYVGVTPGKTYKVKVECDVGNIGDAYASISYSSKINTHAIDVADY